MEIREFAIRMAISKTAEFKKEHLDVKDVELSPKAKIIADVLKEFKNVSAEFTEGMTKCFSAILDEKITLETGSHIKTDNFANYVCVVASDNSNDHNYGTGVAMAARGQGYSKMYKKCGETGNDMIPEREHLRAATNEEIEDFFKEFPESRLNNLFSGHYSIYKDMFSIKGVVENSSAKKEGWE